MLTEIDNTHHLRNNNRQANLREIQKILHDETAFMMRQVQMSAFYTDLITRQKMILVAKQRDDFQRAVYLQDMQIFTGHPDETGAELQCSG